MSPWKCPATFSIISYIEHTGGIHHPIGGLNRIIARHGQGGRGGGGHDPPRHAGASRCSCEAGSAVGVELDVRRGGARRLRGDQRRLRPRHEPPRCHRRALKKWTPEKLEKKGFSCSTFMLYLGVDKLYEDIPHHNIIFAPDYQQNVDEIAENLTLLRGSVDLRAERLRHRPDPGARGALDDLHPGADRQQPQRHRLGGGEGALPREGARHRSRHAAGCTDLRQHIVAETDASRPATGSTR